MDLSPTETQALIVQTTARWVNKALAPLAADADRDGELPSGFIASAAELGFFVDAVPASADGLLEGAYCHVSRALRSIELGRGCGGLAAVLESNVEPALAAAAWAPAQTRSALWQSFASGELATTAYDTRAGLSIESDGDDVILSGEVGPIAVLAHASTLLLIAGTETESPLLCLVSISDADRTPVETSAWRAAGWARLRVSQKRVHADSILARGPAARPAIAQVLAWYRVALGARAVGAASAAMRHAASYAEERIQFGRPIGHFESLRRMRDENETWTAAARALTLQAAWELNSALPSANDSASRARSLACDVLSRATIDAVQIFGGYGFVNDYPVEKLMRDARAFDVVMGNEGLERVLDAATAPV